MDSPWALNAIGGTAGPLLFDTFFSDDACLGTSWVRGGVMTNSGCWAQSVLPK